MYVRANDNNTLLRAKEMENCNSTREEMREVNRAELGRPTFAGCSLHVDATLGGPAVPELPVNVAFGLLNKEVKLLGEDIRCLRDRLHSSVLRERPECDGEKACKDPSAKPAPAP